MKSCRPPLFWKRKFEPEVIITCVRWYLRFCLSLGDLQELMAERGLAVHHTSIWRWIQAYGPEVHRRLSTARNRYIHLPAIRTNVSSICQVDELRLTSPCD